MNATYLKKISAKKLLLILLILITIPIQLNSAFWFMAPLRYIGGYLMGRFMDSIFDRSGFGKVLDQVAEQITGERESYKMLPNTYPKNIQEEQIRLSNDGLQIIHRMQEYMRDRQLSDRELMQKLQEINQTQLTPLLSCVDLLEKRMEALEAKVVKHDSRLTELESEVLRQNRKLLDSQVRTDELYLSVQKLDDLARLEREQIQQNVAQLTQRVDEHDQKFAEINKDGKRRDIKDKEQDYRIENILRTHFHFYYNGLYFKPEFWQNHFENQPIANYQEILFEGAGSGLSLLIERRIRIYGDLYYMLAKPKMPRQKFDAAGNPLLNEVNISGIGANALANLVFFPKRWLSLELGGGYGWTFYTISDQLNNQTLNEYEFRTRGMLGAVTITLTGKKMAVFGQGIGVLKGREIMYGLVKGGISIIF